MARFATYYIRFHYELCTCDWEQRQQHLAALLESDGSVTFDELVPPSRQQQAGSAAKGSAEGGKASGAKGSAASEAKGSSKGSAAKGSAEGGNKGEAKVKVFPHRICHLQCNRDIVVMQIANPGEIDCENNFRKGVAKDEPSCFVVFDNREGLRTVAIQNRPKAFSSPKRLADIMQRTFHRALYGEHFYLTEILPFYYPADLLEVWQMQQANAQLLRFGVSDMTEEKILARMEELKDKPYYDDSLMQPMLKMALAAKQDKYRNMYTLMPEERNGVIRLDYTSSFLRNMLTLAYASNSPVELVTRDGTSFRCTVDSDEKDTDKVVQRELDEDLLDMLFTHRKKNKQEATDEDLRQAEEKITEMLDMMKRTSQDVERDTNTDTKTDTNTDTA